MRNPLAMVVLALMPTRIVVFRRLRLVLPMAAPATGTSMCELR